MKQNLAFDTIEKKRIWELDFIRGFCIFLMIMDHTLYDLAFIFQNQWFGRDEAGGFWYWLCNLARTGYFPWILRDILWGPAVFCFVFICGISCSFSHSNFKRGLRLTSVALVLTGFTWSLDWFTGQENQFTIRFGILHMLAASILLYCLLRRSGQIFMLLSGLFAIAVGAYFSYIPLDTTVDYMAILVHSTANFHSADYFPLLPWFGYFFTGAAIGPWIYVKHRSLFPGQGTRGWMRPILFTGRHSLIFYLFHQPVVYVILSLIGIFTT